MASSVETEVSEVEVTLAVSVPKGDDSDVVVWSVVEVSDLDVELSGADDLVLAGLVGVWLSEVED